MYTDYVLFNKINYIFYDSLADVYSHFFFCFLCPGVETMSSILLQFLVGLLILPLAVLFGVILVLLYTFYSTNLIDVFIKSVAS